MVDYDQVRPYLHSDDLRWSYGAMKGRPEDVGDDVESPAQAEALGFAGVDDRPLRLRGQRRRGRG